MEVIIDGKKKLQSKQESECAPFQRLVFACLEKNLGNKAPCSELIQKYRDCRRNEHHKILLARGGGRIS